MAESLRSKFEEHLTCAVCLEQLKDPKVLPCLHSFCCECILKLAHSAQKNSIDCPECRMTVKVDPADISSMPSNFFVNNLLATMALASDEPAKKVFCDNCDSDDAAASRCNECAIFLCHFCSESHKRYRSTKLHKLLSMGELESSVGPQTVAGKMRCSKHKDEVIKLYCKTCQTTICRDCTIVDHRQHEYGFVEEVADREKQNLQMNLNEVKQRKVKVVKGIAELKKFDEGFEAEKKSTISEVNKHFNKLVRAVESRRNELVEKATSLTNLKQKQIRGQVEELEMALATCESSIQFTEQAFKNGNDVQILSMHNYILLSLQQLQKVKDQTEPCVTEPIVFNVRSSVEDAKQTLLNAFAVDDVLTSLENCSASFTDPKEVKFLELGKQYSITVICNDKNNERIRFGKQKVKPTFDGVQVTDVTVTDNENGSHVVKFSLRQGGMLTFNVTINGKPAPNCVLKTSVKWKISDACGRGVITPDRMGMRGTGTMEFCWRVGACHFESGVHTWQIYMTMPHCIHVSDLFNTVQVGVINCSETFADITGSEDKCVFDINPRTSPGVSLTLDMDAKTLKGSSLPNFRGDSTVIGTYSFRAVRVSPFFSCRSPNVTISVIE